MLRDYDCVELVRTEPRRGALQHFYRATARPNLDEDQWRTLPSGLRARADRRDDPGARRPTSRGGGRRHARGPGGRAHPHAARARRARLQEAQQAAGQDARAGAGDRGRERARATTRARTSSRPSSASCTSSAPTLEREGPRRAAGPFCATSCVELAGLDRQLLVVLPLLTFRTTFWPFLSALVERSVSVTFLLLGLAGRAGLRGPAGGSCR